MPNIRKGWPGPAFGGRFKILPVLIEIWHSKLESFEKIQELLTKFSWMKDITGSCLSDIFVNILQIL